MSLFIRYLPLLYFVLQIYNFGFRLVAIFDEDGSMPIMKESEAASWYRALEIMYSLGTYYWECYVSWNFHAELNKKST